MKKAFYATRVHSGRDKVIRLKRKRPRRHRNIHNLITQPHPKSPCNKVNMNAFNHRNVAVKALIAAMIHEPDSDL